MEPVSNTVLTPQENILAHSKTVWENVMSSLKEVLGKAEITHIQPLGNIGNVGRGVDVYA